MNERFQYNLVFYEIYIKDYNHNQILKKKVFELTKI